MQCIERHLHNLPRLARRELETLPIPLDARKREEVLHQTGQTKILRRDHRQILSCLSRIELSIFQERIDQQLHRSERSLQLMRNRRDKIRLQSRQAKLFSICLAHEK